MCLSVTRTSSVYVTHNIFLIKTFFLQKFFRILSSLHYNSTLGILPNAVAMGKRLADEISTSYGCQSDGATGGCMQAPTSGDVVGMNVGIDGGEKVGENSA